MVRQIYVGTLAQLPSGDPASNVPFTVWDDLVAGNDVTAQLVAMDGVSAYTPLTNAYGLVAHMRGPDNYNELGLYVDTGAGQRFMLPSATAFDAVQSQIAVLQTGGAGGGGGGLPAGTTLDQIPNGATRLALTQTQSAKLDGIADGATKLLIGTTAGTAKSGDFNPTPTSIGAVANSGGVIGILYRTLAQGLPSSVTDGLMVVIPVA